MLKIRYNLATHYHLSYICVSLIIKYKLMKKITFLIFLMIISIAEAQVVFTENFEGSSSIPDSWTNNDIAGNGEVWVLASSGDAVGYNSPNTIYYDNAGMSGNYLLFDSDGYGNNMTAENAAMESPAFDCSSLTSVTLKYNHFFTAGFGGQAAVEVFDGSSWVEVESYVTPPSGDQSNSSFGLVEIDVSNELAGVANAQVRFRWFGNYSWGWAFDNVEVFQCSVAAPGNDITAVSPGDGASNVEIIFGESTSVGQIEWTDPTSGGAVNTYDISLGENPAGDDIGTIAGFESGNIILFDFEPGTTYFWKITGNNCAGSVDSPIFSFTTEACNETNPPVAASAPFPADGATEVNIDGTTNNSIDFTFTSPATANTVLLFGTTDPPTQVFNDFNSGETFGGLDPDTQYFWAIDTYNCVGSTPGTVWSFTTGDVLSNEAFETIDFEYFVDAQNRLNLSANQTLDNVTIYNLLGQQVLIQKLNAQEEIIDLSSLSSGVYLTQVQINGTSETVKILKK